MICSDLKDLYTTMTIDIFPKVNMAFNSKAKCDQMTLHLIKVGFAI
jgi:hypothetical protein